MRKQNRRKFLEMCSLSAGAIMFSGLMNRLSAEENDEEIGAPLSPWKEGNLDIHYIYTGAGENMFLILPDGTSMVLDTGDRPSNQEDEFPLLPNKSRLPSEWAARYIQRVNPFGKNIDYMMLSHYHEDHGGSDRVHAGKTSGRGHDYYLSGLANLGET
ncbi:MAG: MBL fold metallo-hydrolase, partial [Planctomycetia bacterium]|nr:MBL fold metallo-hydrolase [Planctomycetia bacterium]